MGGHSKGGLCVSVRGTGQPALTPQFNTFSPPRRHWRVLPARKPQLRRSPRGTGPLTRPALPGTSPACQPAEAARARAGDRSLCPARWVGTAAPGCACDLGVLPAAGRGRGVAVLWTPAPPGRGDRPSTSPPSTFPCRQPSRRTLGPGTRAQRAPQGPRTPTLRNRLPFLSDSRW